MNLNNWCSQNFHYTKLYIFLGYGRKSYFESIFFYRDKSSGYLFMSSLSPTLVDFALSSGVDFSADFDLDFDLDLVVDLDFDLDLSLLLNQ